MPAPHEPEPEGEEEEEEAEEETTAGQQPRQPRWSAALVAAGQQGGQATFGFEVSSPDESWAVTKRWGDLLALAEQVARHRAVVHHIAEGGTRRRALLAFRRVLS